VTAATRSDYLMRAAQQIVERSRLEQGLPPQINDPAVVGRLATLVAARSFEL